MYQNLPKLKTQKSSSFTHHNSGINLKKTLNNEKHDRGWELAYELNKVKEKTQNEIEEMRFEEIKKMIKKKIRKYPNDNTQENFGFLKDKIYNKEILQPFLDYLGENKYVGFQSKVSNWSIKFLNILKANKIEF